MAEIITATHDADKARDVIPTNTFRDNIPVGLRGRKFHVDGFFPRFHLSEKIGQSQVRVRTSHDVDTMVLD